MFPIRDHNPSNTTPYVTYALIVANIVVFLAYWPLFAEPGALRQFFDIWAILPARITQGEGTETLLTSMFLHGGLLHLAANMLFLHIFGDNLEDEMGHLPYLGFYLASGLAAGLAQVMAAPASTVPMVGASGAIAGVMGGYLLLFPRARVDVIFIFIIFFKVLPLPAWMMLGVWFAVQLVSGAVADLSAGGVAYMAHAGGFLAGMAMTLPLWLRRGGTSHWSRTHGAPANPAATYRWVRTDVPTVRRKRHR
jgi:membrane associated rhomboid family serine protease